MSTATRRGASILDVVVTIGILLVLFALLMPAFNNSRVPAFRNMCKNNLKQLGLALYNYHDVHNKFPPGWVAVRKPDNTIGNSGAYRMGNADSAILDQQPLFQQIDFSQPFGSNTRELDGKLRVVRRRLTVYQCPADPGAYSAASELGRTSYVGNFGVGLPTGPGPLSLPERGQYVHGIFGRNSSVRFDHITDGTSNTVLVGERRLPTKGRDWPEHGVEGSFRSYWSGIPKVGRVSPLSVVATAASGDVTDTSLLNRVGELAGQLPGLSAAYHTPDVVVSCPTLLAGVRTFLGTGGTGVRELGVPCERVRICRYMRSRERSLAILT